MTYWWVYASQVGSFSSSAHEKGGSGDVRTPSPDWLIATPLSERRLLLCNVVCVCLTFPATFGSAEARFTKPSYAERVRKTKRENKFVFTKRNYRKFCSGYDGILRRSTQHGRQRRSVTWSRRPTDVYFCTCSSHASRLQAARKKVKST